jgi:hypothetical protein
VFFAACSFALSFVDNAESDGAHLGAFAFGASGSLGANAVVAVVAIVVSVSIVAVVAVVAIAVSVVESSSSSVDHVESSGLAADALAMGVSLGSLGAVGHANTLERRSAFGAPQFPALILVDDVSGGWA